ncbi:hypothetical protein DWF00_05975 [Bosea caraganae]|uniref:DUF995 domain-containing protein n=1 Tax=Bosea caraganae TaxID=2763117 RepID=A0A370L3D3_9HYPH|nr:hypothetical protein [Bosea caraganae]RDJ22911.1 hypothetical protein DWE98_17220 [Bosea caraganae]RDJ28691.1 hypothetical protein DWF00_05975 [Bosea caraganae]
MKTMPIMAALAVALLFGSNLSAGAVERLTGPQLQKLFEGNTVTGRYSGNNLPFSEHHGIDGRATGHNRNVPNTDACWITVPDGVCYYYGPPESRRTYCFDVDLSGNLYVLRSRPSGRINGIATIEPGDPHKFAQSSKPWTCDGMISQAPAKGPAMSRRQLAAR